MARHELVKQVKDIIAKSKVVEIYPEGSNKEFAMNVLERTKRLLINYITEYDGCRKEWCEYTGEEEPTSYDVIKSICS